MKNLFIILFIAFLFFSFPLVALAEQVNNEVDLNLDEVQQSPAWTGYNIRAGGGPEMGWLNLNLEDLNIILVGNGFPEINNNLFIYGSSGIAGRKIGNRFGGITLKGSTESRYGDKKSELSINYSGLLYKRGFYANRNLEISAGALFGTGGMQLRLLSDDLEDFENIVEDIGDGRHNTVTMEKSFIAINPRINLAYSIIGPVDISASAGYLLTHDFGSNWEIASREIGDGPLSNFRAFNLTFQLHLGF